MVRLSSPSCPLGQQLRRICVDYDYIKSPTEYYELYYKALYNYYTSQGQSAYSAWLSANSHMGMEQGQGGLGFLVYSVPDGQALIGQNGKLNPSATPRKSGEQQWTKTTCSIPMTGGGHSGGCDRNTT